MDYAFLKSRNTHSYQFYINIRITDVVWTLIFSYTINKKRTKYSTSSIYNPFMLEFPIFSIELFVQLSQNWFWLNYFVNPLFKSWSFSFTFCIVYILLYSTTTTMLVALFSINSNTHFHLFSCAVLLASRLGKIDLHLEQRRETYWISSSVIIRNFSKI